MPRPVQDPENSVCSCVRPPPDPKIAKATASLTVTNTDLLKLAFCSVCSWSDVHVFMNSFSVPYCLSQFHFSNILIYCHLPWSQTLTSVENMAVMTGGLCTLQGHDSLNYVPLFAQVFAFLSPSAIHLSTWLNTLRKTMKGIKMIRRSSRNKS